MNPLLTVKGLLVRFGGIVALDDVTFEVQRGHICGIIGPNGSGKTTLFNCLSRLYRPAAGEIMFDGHALLRFPEHRIAHLGIGRTFQNVALFRTLTVRDNVLVGAHSRRHGSFISDALRLPQVARDERRASEQVIELLDLLGLARMAATIVSDLTFGSQKRVELARALAAQPKLLLLDEPAAGLSHEEVQELAALIVSIRDRLRTTILLVEHHMNLVMRISDQVVALNFGRVIERGPPAQVQRHPEVIRAYLGSAA
jgi:branched-chain amino acid transport system ATP-binding protein